REVLEKTAAQTRQGRGTCVGRRFPGVEVRIIRPVDGPIASLTQAEILPAREIGEIIVKSSSVTREYFENVEGTRLAKISDGDCCWHRIGDMGYLDHDGLLWFCGRKAHIVETGNGKLYSVCCEAIFNNHPRVYRSALVGFGSRPRQTPAIVVEPEEGGFPLSPTDETQFRSELIQLAEASDLTHEIREVFFHPSLPVDTRHNVKIDREALAEWAAQRRMVSPGQ
ncbi:MAG: AMP-binding protein, partial [Planctomycetaceae bacterium]|nr:AMP-binding protein [Planctomycetaceae bacterium]